MYEKEIDGLREELEKESKRQRAKGNVAVAESLEDLRFDLGFRQVEWRGEEEGLRNSFCMAMCVLLYWRTFGD